ncbi:unnamed protein product [Allacma fusca]|uniref:Uncharacterized protein n=1 Tax=Allacma fusca TaxID=39272 RepID=A0A8J2NU19_9HEXA|nr:unnamed protein product [Allacma fusca]
MKNIENETAFACDCITKMPVLYDGDNIDEFLELCPDGCDFNCPILFLDANVVPPQCTKEEKEILMSLETAQKSVREFREAILAPITSSVETMFLYSLMTVVFIMGMILIFRGHFHFKTLFCKDFPDPTYGIPIWQFQLMKFTPCEVPDTRPQNVRIAELHRRLEKKNAEREALRQLRERLREQKHSILSDHERQLQMVEEELAAEAARLKQKKTTIADKRRKRHPGRRRSGAMSAKFIEADDYASMMKTRKRKMTMVQAGRLSFESDSGSKPTKDTEPTEESRSSNASDTKSEGKKQRSPKHVAITEPGKSPDGN